MSIDLPETALLASSPCLKRLIATRLAPSRLASLLAAARSLNSPEPPAPWDCCGSSCSPCVTTLWKEERKVWRECHDNWEEIEEGERAEKEERERQEEEEREEKEDSARRANEKGDGIGIGSALSLENLSLDTPLATVAS